MKIKEFFLFVVIISYTATSLFAQDKKPKDVDLMTFIEALLITQKEGQNMKQMWLLPKEYWVAALQDSQFGADETFINEFTEVLGSYLIIGCLDIEISSLGEMTKLEKTIAMVSKDGDVYKPIPEEEQELEVKNMVSTMKPMISNMLGQLGKKYDFYVFPNKDKEGNEILTPYKPGGIKVVLNKTDFVYRTPFSALIPSKKCTNDNEEVSGNWVYCPWHGDTLELKK